MKKTIKMMGTMLVVACLVASISGCAERSIVVAQHASEPDMVIKDDVEIDWDQVRSDCEDVLNEEDYPDGSYIDFAVHEDEKVVELIWPLKESATQVESLDYGKAFIKTFNDAVATQDFKYAFSTEDNYGGFWDAYGIDLQVYPESVIMFPDQYFVNQVMDPGSNDPVLPQIITQTDSTQGDTESATEETTSQDSTKQ